MKVCQLRGCRLVGSLVPILGVLLISTATLADVTIDARYSGSWFDPAKDGQGFTLQVINESTMLATWFTFDGEGNPAWMQGVGSIVGNQVLFEGLNRYTGPRFGLSYDPADRITAPSGSLKLTFSSCGKGVAEYTGQAPFPTDTLNLSRLTHVAGFNCDQPVPDSSFPLHHGLSGAWYAPALDGQGWMVEILNADQALVYWFTYTPEGDQRWMLGLGDIKDRAIHVSNLQTASGAKFGPDYDPDDVTRARWGSLTLALWPCQGAQVTYAEGAGHLAKATTIEGVEPLVAINQTQSCPPDITKYSAARLLDQTTFGPTPEMEATVHKMGPEAFVEDQLNQPPSFIKTDDMHCMENFEPDRFGERQNDLPYWDSGTIRIFDLFIAAPDQLRLRTSWALSQLLVVSSFSSDIQEIGTATYFNMLQEHALGNFRDLLRAVTLHPTMGQFLDNGSSFATSEQCPECLPNENYARELLMLFTIGVNDLNLDGSLKQGADGQAIETFTQKDVMELARALSGWRTPEDDPNDPRFEDCEQPFIQYDRPMVPHTGYPQPAHDPGEKVLLGTTIPAGQGIHQDLESVLDILMNHPNMPPFISYRLIQHLTTSNPSPDYVRRVAQVFKDNGQGITGDLKATIRAIIMDPEARAGDVPENQLPNFGRIRDLVQRHTALARGMECPQLPHRNYWGEPGDRNYLLRGTPRLPNNRPFGAPEVFNFYPPNHQVPGMDLIAPEHMLINFNGVQAMLSPGWGDRRELADCNIELFESAIESGPDALIQLMKDRYFRGQESFAHEAVMHQFAEGLQSWLANNKASDDPEIQNAMYQFSVFIAYTLLGEEFGVVR